MKKIKDYRKINSEENYFLASAIYSIAKSLGIDYDNEEWIIPDAIVKGGMYFVSAITGDMFAYMYSKQKPSDSGITSSFFMPDVVKKSYAVFRYDCVYFSKEQINSNYKKAINAIKKSIDNNIPVLGWGMGMDNIKYQNGSYYDVLGEGCLIGGYDDNDNIFVNLYPGAEQLETGAVDEDGYTLIKDGLKKSDGIFIVGEKIKKPELNEVYKDIIYSIPSYLNRKDEDGYSFGKKAFDAWAETLLDNSIFVNKTDEELGGLCWSLHLSPFCNICTMASYSFIKKATELFPQIEIAHKLLPLYETMLNKAKDIYNLQGDFYTPIDKFRTYDFRKQIADVLISMGKTCDEIVKVFEN